MIVRPPARLTYAQKKLLPLIENRKLREFCFCHGVEHNTLYKLIIGGSVPTYKTMSQLVHVVSPIEWFFYEDEELPYEPQILPGWDLTKTCFYVKKHENNWQGIAKKYGLDPTTAKRLFEEKSIYPPVKFIRNACDETNPIEFFMEGDVVHEESFELDRGDVVAVGVSHILILTDIKFFKKNKCAVGCTVSNKENDFAVEINSKAGKWANPFSIVIARDTDGAYKIEKVNGKALSLISKRLKALSF